MDSREIKKKLGEDIAKRVNNGETIGIGTGSTADAAIVAIGERIKKEGLTVYSVPTSDRTESLARSVGIKIAAGDQKVSWGFDGADEVERQTLNILKGAGGAMTREKLLAKKCGRWIVLIDESKLVDQLGEKFPIPLEVLEDQMHRVIENLYEKYQAVDIRIRQILSSGAGPAAGFPPKSATREPLFGGPPARVTHDSSIFLTDFRNPVIDVQIEPGSVKPEWEKEWEMMPGVVGTGLFLGGYPDEVWVGKSDGTIEKLSGPGRRP